MVSRRLSVMSGQLFVILLLAVGYQDKSPRSHDIPANSWSRMDHTLTLFLSTVGTVTALCGPS